MKVKHLPKPGSYAYYLQQYSYLTPVQQASTPLLSKKGFKAQKKAENQAQKAAQQAANAAAAAAAAAAGSAAGSQLAAGLLPGEAQLDTGGGGSVPFAGGSTSGKLATVAAVVVPFGLLGLVAWYLLKKRKRR